MPSGAAGLRFRGVEAEGARSLTRFHTMFPMHHMIGGRLEASIAVSRKASNEARSSSVFCGNVKKQVWLDHHWDNPALANVRERLCRNGTASAECAVPMAGFPLGSPELWCQAKYDSSECLDIKEEVRGRQPQLAGHEMEECLTTQNCQLSLE